MPQPNPMTKINENKLLIVSACNDIKTLLSEVKYLRTEIKEIKKKIAELSKDEPVVVEKSSGWFFN